MKQSSATRIKRVTRHSASYPRTVPTLMPPLSSGSLELVTGTMPLIIVCPTGNDLVLSTLKMRALCPIQNCLLRPHSKCPFSRAKM